MKFVSREHPTLYVIAGPNGAGKTTFARHYLPRYAECEEFINMDLIANGLSPFSPERAAVEAGRIMLQRLEELAKQRKPFAIETTLAGKRYAEIFKRLKRLGYGIDLYYLWLPRVSLALHRITERVRSGGHDVPEPDVRRRFKRSLSNFFRLYRPLVDRWVLFDNSGAPPRLIAHEAEGRVKIWSLDVWEQIQEQLEAL
jgi:predicted ABC-type ATPase